MESMKYTFITPDPDSRRKLVGLATWNSAFWMDFFTFFARWIHILPVRAIRSIIDDGAPAHRGLTSSIVLDLYIGDMAAHKVAFLIVISSEIFCRCLQNLQKGPFIFNDVCTVHAGVMLTIQTGSTFAVPLITVYITFAIPN